MRDFNEAFKFNERYSKETAVRIHPVLLLYILEGYWRVVCDFIHPGQLPSPECNTIT